MFRRRTPAQPEGPASRDADGVLPDDGKGRPTPKRREAEQHRRQRASAPKDRKEAYRQTRSRQREQRVKMRQALVSGDERHLPPRDRGPVRRYARDYVDSRRCAAELFLPSAVLILALGLLRTTAAQLASSMIWLALILLMVVDSVILVRRLKKQLHSRWPGEDFKGVTGYVLLRSLQLRRLRLPKPRVKPGQPIPT